jgi:hypothetical protein
LAADDVELEFQDEDPTPRAPMGLEACRICRMVVAVRIRSDVQAPSCEREARAFQTCVCTQDDSWALCAAKLLIEAGAFRWYFGPENRKNPLRLPPPGMPERRGKLPPPFPPRKDDA